MSDWRSRPKKYHINPEWFREVYAVRELPVKDIAAQIGCCVPHLRYFARKFGIEIRNGQRGHKVPCRRSKIDVVEATRLYVDERWPSDKIAEHFGCNTSTVLRRLRESGVRVRHHNDTKRGAKARNRIELDVDAVLSAYRVKWANAASVAKQFGVSNGVVMRILDENNEPRKPWNDLRDCFGENSPSWRPDISPEEREQRRNYNLQADWRVKVFARDQHTCQCCGDARGHNLNAHHIEPHYRNKALRWEVSNGITFCAPCHRAYHRAYGFKRCNASTLAQFLSDQNKQAA